MEPYSGWATPDIYNFKSGMTHQEAVGLIQGAHISPGGVWADLRAGNGRFSHRLWQNYWRPEGTVYAIDNQISRIVAPATSALIYMQKADFTQPLDLPILDGLLMANSLHYVKEKGPFSKQRFSNIFALGNVSTDRI
ncbi:MAG: hypothetical protein R3B93_27215 [Bacteroidia bacterium]